MLLSQPDYTHSFKRMPQLLIPLFKNQWFYAIQQGVNDPSVAHNG